MQILDVGGCLKTAYWMEDSWKAHFVYHSVLEDSCSIKLARAANIWFVNLTNYWGSTTIHA